MKLYLGIVPGLYPWLEEVKIMEKMKKLDVGIIFSFWNFRKKTSEIIQSGLKEFFSWDGSIIVDSGAYSAFNSGVEISISKYVQFLKRINLGSEDIVVNLDSIGNPRKSKRNWELLNRKFAMNILPVVHYPDNLNYYKSEKYIGLGGVVPALKINQKGSVYDIAEWLGILKSSSDCFFHGFGIGSPYHQIAFLNHLYSIDWIGWRRNAAMCSCYTPEGSVYIHEALYKKKFGKGLNQRLFECYSPPFIENYEQLTLRGTLGWKNRALWNVWWFLNAQEFKEKVENSTYVKRLQKLINS